MTTVRRHTLQTRLPQPCADGHSPDPIGLAKPITPTLVARIEGLVGALSQELDLQAPLPDADA